MKIIYKQGKKNTRTHTYVHAHVHTPAAHPCRTRWDPRQSCGDCCHRSYHTEVRLVVGLRCCFPAGRRIIQWKPRGPRSCLGLAIEIHVREALILTARCNDLGLWASTLARCVHFRIPLGCFVRAFVNTRVATGTLNVSRVNPLCCILQRTKAAWPYEILSDIHQTPEE